MLVFQCTNPMPWLFLCFCLIQLWSTINIPFFGFFRELVHIKTQQSTYKASKHNGGTVFLPYLVLLTIASAVVVSTLFYHLSSIFITLAQKMHQLPLFSSASVTEKYATTNIVLPPFGLVGHYKAYDCFSPQLSNKVDTTTTEYLIASDLSAHHCA